MSCRQFTSIIVFGAQRLCWRILRFSWENDSASCLYLPAVTATFECHALLTRAAIEVLYLFLAKYFQNEEVSYPKSSANFVLAFCKAIALLYLSHGFLSIKLLFQVARNQFLGVRYRAPQKLIELHQRKKEWFNLCRSVCLCQNTALAHWYSDDACYDRGEPHFFSILPLTFGA